MSERITTTCGTFRLASQNKEELESLGYGYQCEAGDGEHIIMCDGTKAVAVRMQPESAMTEPETEAETETETVAESETQSVESEPAKTHTIEEIAKTFANQEKYHDEMWSYNHPETNDCLVQYWYSWEDKDGFTYKDHVDIFLSDACRASWIDFDCIDDGDVEGRALEEMAERGYTVDDDNEIVIEEGMNEYAVREEMNDIRAELWEQARDETTQARDELCLHENLDEGWFRELCEEMLDKINATMAE